MKGQFARPVRGCVIALLAVAILPSFGVAEETSELFANVESAIKANRLLQSRTNGLGKDTYSVRSKKPGVLIGFEVGLGPWLNLELVYALRPIYLTADGESKGGAQGLFEAFSKDGKMIGAVTRTVTVKARPGYAVSGMTVRSGLLINGLALNYQRIDGSRLDPNDGYTSKWIGDRTGGGEVSFDSKSMVVVGIHGRNSDRNCQSIGLTYLDPAALPAADPKPQAEPATAPKSEPQETTSPKTETEPAAKVEQEPAEKVDPVPEEKPSTETRQPQTAVKAPTPEKGDMGSTFVMIIGLLVAVAVGGTLFLVHGFTKGRGPQTKGPPPLPPSLP